jgi:hypothetical protein
MTRTRYETAEAFSVAQELGIDFATESFTLEDFREGMDAELTHCLEHPEATSKDPVGLGMILLQHLRADPSYYHRLLEGTRTREPRERRQETGLNDPPTR